MIRPIAVSLTAALVLAACTSVPRSRGVTVDTSGGNRVVEASPIEVAVAPVVVLSGRNVPAQELRAGFHKALVDRRYSPLSLEYVDRRVVDAAYAPGSSEEQAVLSIRVESWDTGLWTTHGAITARVTAQMIAARGGEVLWSGTADRRFDFPDLREHLSTERARTQYACDQIAVEILSRLPVRVPRPGYLEGTP